MWNSKRKLKRENLPGALKEDWGKNWKGPPSVQRFRQRARYIHAMDVDAMDVDGMRQRLRWKRTDKDEVVEVCATRCRCRLGVVRIVGTGQVGIERGI